MLDIADDNSNLLIGAIPLAPGGNLLEQYGYLEIGSGPTSQLFVTND